MNNINKTSDRRQMLKSFVSRDETVQIYKKCIDNAIDSPEEHIEQATDELNTARGKRNKFKERFEETRNNI